MSRERVGLPRGAARAGSGVPADAPGAADPRAPERLGRRERESARGDRRLPGARNDERRGRAVARLRGRRTGTRRGDGARGGADRDCGRVPVTGDLERGYGDPVGTARAAWEAGLVGINFEDSTRRGSVDVDEQAHGSARSATAVPDLVINARVDTFLGTAAGSPRGRRARRTPIWLPVPTACTRFSRRSIRSPARAPDQRADQRDREPGTPPPRRARGTRRRADDLGLQPRDRGVQPRRCGSPLRPSPSRGRGSRARRARA